MIGTKPRVEADALAVEWESALDAATRAVDAGRGERLSAGVLEHERRRLTQERHDVSELLRWLATNRGHASDGWLPPRAVTPHMLGLPGDVRAIVFDLEGVLTDSDVLHAAAWAEALDPVLLQLSHDLGWAFVPFDLDGEYRLYFDGRPRLEGIRLFFAGRGIRLPEGSPTDGEDVPTLYGVSRHKGTLLEHGLHTHRLAALPGARRYLQAAAHARIACAAVSASESTRSMLQLARIDHLVDDVLDAEEMRRRALRARPAPDVLVAACEALGVSPDQSASLTHSGAGVAAAAQAGLAVVGVASGAQAERLRGFGADHVEPSLWTLLDPALRA